MNIDQKIKNIGGNLKISILKIKDDFFKCFILFVDEIISTIVIIQENENITYLTYVDSTGYKRISSLFLKFLIEDFNKIVILFSHTQNEIILGESSKNKNKKIYSNYELYNFWKFILNQIPNSKIIDWSNYNKSDLLLLPYKKINQIPNFIDDPKTKMSRNFKNINDFYNGLLFRNDFDNGGALFYLIKSEIKNEIKNEVKNKLEDFIFIDINKIMNFLKLQKFDTEENAKKSTKNFINEFNLEMNYFKTNNTKLIKLKKNEYKKEIKQIKPKYI